MVSVSHAGQNSSSDLAGDEQVHWQHSELSTGTSEIDPPSAITKGDLNEDGNDDLLVAYPFKLLVYLAKSGLIRPPGEQPEANPSQSRPLPGPFERPQSYELPFAATLLGIKDVNEDGNADVVATDGQQSVFLPGDGKGGLGDAEPIRMPSNAWRQMSETDSGVQVLLHPDSRSVTIQRPGNLQAAGGQHTDRQAAGGQHTDIARLMVRLDDKPLAAVAMDLNGDPIPDLVVVHESDAVPSLITSAPLRTFTVNSAETLESFDVNPGDGICRDQVGHCTLPAATAEANASLGLDLIRFNIPGALPILIGNGFASGSYAFTDPVIVDGTTQPGYQGKPVVQLQGRGVGGDAITLSGGNSLVRGLAISGYASSEASPSGRAIVLQGAGGNVVERNCIGTDTSCTRSAGGGNFRGIEILSSNNTVGGTAAGAGNVVAFSNGLIDGVVGDNRNAVGIGVNGGTGNAVLGNSLFNNRGLGIDLYGAPFELGVTPNDAGDRDRGPNNKQNFPVLTQVSSVGGSTRVQGTLNSLPNKSYRIEFFANPSCDVSGFGEGRRFLGARSVSTNASGNASFAVSLPIAVPAGQSVTATATDPANNTSEFSRCRALSS